MSDLVELLIERVGSEGHGVGQDPEGAIVFVSGAVPGDTVRARIEESRGRYRYANLESIVKPSPHRISPACPHFQECGGCDWLQWRYEDQLAAKAATVKHILARNSIACAEILPPIGAEQTFGYRTRIQVRAEAGKIGFYRRKSHEIVDVEHCAVATPAVNEQLRLLRNEVKDWPGRHKFELVQDEAGEVQQFQDARHASGGFAQIHQQQNQKLQQLVSNLVTSGGANTVLELFCGSGNLTFAYSEKVRQVLAVDLDEVAIEKGRTLREERGGKTPIAFFAMAADGTLARRLPPDFRESYDTLICDPPRSGLAGSVRRLIHSGLKHFIYVSCSPMSFSRDCQWIAEHLSLRSVQPIDMFPQTRHVELVAHFSRD